MTWRCHPWAQTNESRCSSAGMVVEHPKSQLEARACGPESWTHAAKTDPPGLEKREARELTPLQ